MLFSWVHCGPGWVQDVPGRTLDGLISSSSQPLLLPLPHVGWLQVSVGSVNAKLRNEWRQSHFFMVGKSQACADIRILMESK